jgi:hypothetical protein
MKNPRWRATSLLSHDPGTRSWQRKSRTAFACMLASGLLLASYLPAKPGDLRKQYWATSLSGSVDDELLSGLYRAIARNEVGWLDVDPTSSIPPLEPSINLILYHVGGNCYVGDDCDRFPSSEPTGDRWGATERQIDLDDPIARKIVIGDLVRIVKQGDKIAPAGSIVGIHLDNVHKLAAQALADTFNEFLAEVEAARKQGSISKSRKVGYVAKNNPKRFAEALEKKLLRAPPLYQINENARLDQEGTLDAGSQIAQEIGSRCSIPVFLKTFGSDVAYTIVPDDSEVNVAVSEDMARQMAQMPNISGVAWSADEGRYHPTLFAQGSGVKHVPFGAACGE